MSPARPERGDVDYPLFARFYAEVLRRAERNGPERERLVAGLSGRVVEVGPGDGPNFELYPPAVTEVVAVEPEAELRERAKRNAERAPVPVRVVDGLADALPVEDGSADAVVFGLVLCSVPDQGAALAEARRILKPGGELRVFEHVVAVNSPGRALQRGLDATVWPRFFGGCTLCNDTGGAVEAAGFEWSELERLSRPRVVPPAPVILGRARLRAVTQ